MEGITHAPSGVHGIGHGAGQTGSAKTLGKAPERVLSGDSLAPRTPSSSFEALRAYRDAAASSSGSLSEASTASRPSSPPPLPPSALTREWSRFGPGSTVRLRPSVSGEFSDGMGYRGPQAKKATNSAVKQFGPGFRVRLRPSTGAMSDGMGYRGPSST